MSYLARLKQRLHRDVSGCAPTELTEGACVGSVRELPGAKSQIEACLERLDCLLRCVPSGASIDQWLARIDAAKAFTRSWTPVASQLGWSMKDLYSLHPRAPLQRLDAMGAAYCTGTGRVTAVTADAISLEVAPRRLLTLRRPTLVVAPAWETFCSVRIEA